MPSWLSASRAFTGIAAQPTFSPAGGTYTSSQSVTISTVTPSATIYYTQDGSTPTTGSTRYIGPVTVSGTETLKAIAILPGNAPSTIGSASYVIQGGAAFDFYISTTGSDSNAGTLSQPWALTSMLDSSPNFSKWAGKRLGLLPGTYNVGSLQSGLFPSTGYSSNYNYSVLAIPYGTSASPTYVGSSDTNGFYSPRTATIIGGTNQGGNAIVGPDYSTSGDFYVTVDGLIINANGQAILHCFAAYSGTGSIYNGGGTAKGITVQNCEIHGIAGTGGGNNWSLVFLECCEGAVIQNNYLHDVTNTSQPDHIHAGENYGCQGTKFLYNTVARTGSAFDAKEGDSNIECAYNYATAMQWCAWQGFDGANGNPNTPPTPSLIHHNVMDSNDGSSTSNVLFGDQNQVTSTQAVYFYSNTIYDPASGSNQLVRLGMSGTGGGSQQHYNNIYYCPSNTGGGGSAHPGQMNVSTGYYTTLDYNCYDFATFALGLDSATYSTLSAYRTATSAETHSITGNPGFVGSIVTGHGPAQFQLASNSPCLGTGQGGANMGAWDGTVTQIGCNFSPAIP